MDEFDLIRIISIISNNQRQNQMTDENYQENLRERDYTHNQFLYGSYYHYNI